MLSLRLAALTALSAQYVVIAVNVALNVTLSVATSVKLMFAQHALTTQHTLTALDVVTALSVQLAHVTQSAAACTALLALLSAALSAASAIALTAVESSLAAAGRRSSAHQVAWSVGGRSAGGGAPLTFICQIKIINVNFLLKLFFLIKWQKPTKKPE